MARYFREKGCETQKIDWESARPDEKKHACSVLITCAHPGEDGKMNVEMTYEGDPTLASFLLQSAQGYLEEGEAFSD